jgi:hypothetical protein
MILRYNNNLGELVDRRELHYWRTWQTFDSESVLLKFINPEEIRNTAFLSITVEDKIRQMIFLPGLAMTKRIKNTKMNSSFMNSDFFFSDLKSWELKKNDNRLIEETSTHFIVESKFHKKWINQRLIIKINKTNSFIDEIQYYTKGCEFPNRIMKILEKKQLKDLLIPIHIEMTSYLNCSQKIRSSSEIIFKDYDVNSQIDEAVFTEAYMTNMEF